ncbi:hypothetical protein KEM56_004802 [Ascosphaera pollenicola]|nr:hypothetical protein KEM56_004802 [Ascosphaera pollenicola]
MRGSDSTLIPDREADMSVTDGIKSVVVWGILLPLAFNIPIAFGYVVEYIFYVLYSILFASTASFLALAYASYAKHSGIPEIKSILNGLVIREFLSPMTLLIKSLGLCLAVASGLWLGKEGPLIHVACCCANLFMKPIKSLYHNEARRREILAAAAASGISVAFGSPIGGVLFSLEQVASYFPDRTMWRSFVCAMVAAVTLHAVNPFRTGKIVLYQVTYTRGWHSFEIFPFILLGIMGGLYGAFLIKINMKVARWSRAQSFRYPVLIVALVALVSALINFPNIFMRAQLSELVHYLFSQCSDSPDDPFLLCKTGAASWATIGLLLTAAFLGFCLASITFGLDIPAGIILPTLAIGALYGRALGIAMEMWQAAHPSFFLFDACEPDSQCITPGIYAIIGAAAALGGASRMTVSIVVIMFELTGALTYVVPIMISVMLSKWCGDIFGKKSIYESWIHFKGYTFLDHKEDMPSLDVNVRDVMTRLGDLTVITAVGHTIETLTDILEETSYRGFPIVKESSDPVLLGYISRGELLFSLNSATMLAAEHLPKETPVCFNEWGLNSFSPLPSFRRIVVSFKEVGDAVKVRTYLEIKGLRTTRNDGNASSNTVAASATNSTMVREADAVFPRVYFGETTPLIEEGELAGKKNHLELPPAAKLFFISPPPSPPAGWQVKNEDPPNKEVIASDLEVALRKLGGTPPEQQPHFHGEGYPNGDDYELTYTPASITPTSPTFDDAGTSNSKSSSMLMSTTKCSQHFRNRSMSATIIYNPEDHGSSATDLPAVMVEDTTAAEPPAIELQGETKTSPVEKDPGVPEMKNVKTSRPPVELM